MKNILEKVKVTFSNYYVSIILFIIGTTLLMSTIYGDYYGNNISTETIKLILTFIYGAIISVVIKHIIDSISKVKLKNLLYLVIPLLMIFVYYIVLGELGNFTNSLSYILLCFLSGITLFSIPFIGKDTDSDYYSYEALISLGITMLCYFILVVGIFLIMGSISSLFEINIKEYLYMEIGVCILGYFMPTLFLSLIPEANLKEEYPEFINKLALYVIYPILTIYTVILYAYFIKILLSFNIPSNMLGNLTIYYSIISIVILYFTSNLKYINKWSNKFISIYPYALIIPNIMMLITFIERINNYGFTEIRYYGILLFVFSICSIVMIKLKDKLKYIPLILSGLLLISIIGPLSCFNISKISQEKRFNQLLVDTNMVSSDKIVNNPNLSIKNKNKIIDMLVYFDDRDCLDDIDILPDGFSINNMEEVFGFSLLEFYHY